MAKRRLSNRQQARIAAQQRDTASRAEQLQHGLVIAHHGKEVEVLAGAGDCINVFRCKLRANLPAVVCGDRVFWQRLDDASGSAVVESLQQRESVIVRPRPHGEAKPIAANVDLIVLVLAPSPAPVANLLDRYLIAATNADIPTALLVNKSDLLAGGCAPAAAQQEVLQLASLYRELGYPVYHFSARSPVNAAIAASSVAVPESKALPASDLLRGKTSILVGQSGVGKSSIINAICSAATADTAEISDANSKGRHTTTNARLYFLDSAAEPGAGAVIDSPGIREFALWHLDEQDIIDGMPEFREKSVMCRFRDCRHGESAGCAIQAAIDSGEFHPSRVASYRHILANLDP